ncbi:MAG: RNA pseudouridine synthase [Bacteroidales bacterium]|nr:RNA pseudouridine synthase [Bacteroidales bacterium]
MEIIYEDNHIIAVNKTHHDLVQQDITGDLSLDQKVKAYIKEKYNRPGNVFLGVVHRLDRPVTGVVIFARTGKALSRLTSMFREGKMEKTYWAIIKNKPEEESGRLLHHLERNPSQNKSFSYDHPRKGSKEAALRYRVIGRSERYHLLEIDLETGRHHQIRSQLAHIGCPVKGDLKYGYPRSNPDGGISLHARQLRFMHPVSQHDVVIVAETPSSEKLWNSFKFISS